MKLLSILILSLFVTSANATEVRKSVVQASDIEFVRAKCPPGKACAAVVKYVAFVTYKARGCLDTLKATAKVTGPTEDGNYVLKLRGVNYHNPRSAKVKCIAQPQETFEFKLSAAVNPARLEIVEATR